MSNSNTHIFEYRFPRIKEGLTHREVVVGPFNNDAKEGAYLFFEGSWFHHRRRKVNGGPSFITIEIHSDHVPREIRTWALLLT